MKLFFAVNLAFLLSFSPCLAQEVSCTDLMEYVISEGYRKGTVSNIQLLNSSWLTEVKAYDINGSIAVIAEIKQDEWGFNTKKYIFCGISSTTWDAFYYGLYDYNTTYGERFHKYIIDYLCNCY